MKYELTIHKMRTMSQFEEMQNFIRIVESGSITQAAEQSGTVKSAVSRRLSDLEKRLGVTLIARTTRSQSLTTSGKSYYQRSLQILDDLAELESSVKNDQCALRGQIKISAPLSFGLLHLSSALTAFNDLHPDIRLDVDFNDRKIDMIEEGFDLVFRISKLADSNFIAKKITSINLHLVASPIYLKKYGTPMIPNDLNSGHVKLHYNDSSETWHFKTDAKDVPIKLDSVMNSNNGDFLVKACLEGKGLKLTPDFLVYKYLKTGQLKKILSDYLPEHEIGAYAMYPQTRHLSRRVRSLVDFLSQYFGPEPYWRI